MYLYTFEVYRVEKVGAVVIHNSAPFYKSPMLSQREVYACAEPFMQNKELFCVRLLKHKVQIQETEVVDHE